MKNFKSIAIAFMLLIATTSFVNAQSKVAHIDTQALLTAMPEMKAAQSQLEKLQKTYDTEIKNLMKEFEAKVTQYGNEQDSKTEAENTARAQEVQEMQNNIAAYREQAIQDLRKKEGDVFNPIREKAQNAIQKVARSLGYQYVLDSASGSGILLADGKDLLPEVKKELGI
ncbi:MAG: OmpH family outer membrane protein [Flavobacteriales bacterium]